MSNKQRVANTMIEMVITFSIIGLLMGVGMWTYRGLLFRQSIYHETDILKRNLEYAQQWAHTYDLSVAWELNEHDYMLLSETGKTLRKHIVPKRINIQGKSFSFHPNMIPTQGQTIILTLSKYTSRVIIDPGTGRIRVAR